MLRYPTRNIEQAQATLEKFGQELKENAAFAFEWGDSAIAAAASLREWRQLQRVAEAEGGDIAGYLAKTQDDMLMLAKSDSSSTSQCTNVVARSRLSAMADIVETLRAILLATA